MNKKFAIFDMDGTLVDSGTVWGQTSAGYFAGLGVTIQIGRASCRERV